MKKNVKSEKVLRAITIGISAMLAVNSMPLTVLADETDGTSEPDNNDSSVSTETENSSVTSEAQAAADTTQESTDAAQSACDNVVGEITRDASSNIETSDSTAEVQQQTDSEQAVANVVDPVVEGEAGTDEEEKDLAGAVIDAAEDLQNTISGSTENTFEVKDNEGNIIEKSTIDDNLTDAKASLEDVDTASKTANHEAKAASSVVNDVQKVADEIDDYMNGSQKTEEDGSVTTTEGVTQKAEALAEQITNATTVDDANKAYDELKGLTEEAEQKVAAATDQLSELQKKYDAAMKALKGAESAYHYAVKSACSDAKNAQSKLDDAQDKVDKLQKAIENAQAGVEAKNQAALDIIKIQNALKEKTGNGAIWQGDVSLDKLFDTIMTNYYVPQILGEKSGAKDISVTRKQGVDNDSYNYFEVSYTTSEGETKTVYYNYVLDGKSMDGKSKTDILIFEKTEDEVKAGEAVRNYYDSLTGTEKSDFRKNVKNQTVYKYTVKENGKEVTKYICQAEVDSRKDDFITLKDSGTLYLKGEAGEAWKLTNLSKKDTTIAANSDETTKEDTIDEDTRKSYFEIRNGVLTEVETADINTTTYKKTGVESDKFTNEEAAKAALEAAKKALEGKDVTLDELKSISSWITSGEYYETFTNRLTGKKNVTWGEGLWGLITGTDAVNNEWKELVSDIKSECKDQGNYTGITIGDVTAQKDKNILGYKKYKFDGTFSYDGKKHFSVGSEGTEADSEEASKELWMKKADEAAKSDSLKGFSKTSVKSWFGLEEGNLYDATATVNYEDVKTTELKKFYYILEYLEQTGDITTEEAKEIKTIKYEVAAELANTIRQNSNYLDGNISLDENDDSGLKDFINNAQAKVDKYNQYAVDAEKAKEAVDQAKEDADALVGAIEELGDIDKETGKFKDNFSAAKILGVEDVAAFLGIDLPEEDKEAFNKKTIDEVKEYLDDLLKKAEKKVTEAEIKLAVVETKRENAEKDLDDTLKRLTENPIDSEIPVVPETPPVPQKEKKVVATQTEETTTTTTTSTTTDSSTVTEVSSEVAAPTGIFTMPFGLDVLPTAGVAGARVARTAGTAEPEGGVAGARREIVKEDAAEEQKKEVASVILGDEEVPLAAVPEEEKANMNWWWLVVVALLGATGYELYRKHEAKKKAEVTVDNTENE